MNKYNLIVNNTALVHYCIHKYWPTYQNDEDLVQCGMVGLCKAANGYDENKGAFSTYAITIIKNEIGRELSKRMKDPIILSLEQLTNKGRDLL